MRNNEINFTYALNTFFTRARIAHFKASAHLSENVETTKSETKKKVQRQRARVKKEKTHRVTAIEHRTRAIAFLAMTHRSNRRWNAARTDRRLNVKVRRRQAMLSHVIFVRIKFPKNFTAARRRHRAVSAVEIVCVVRLLSVMRLLMISLKVVAKLIVVRLTVAPTHHIIDEVAELIVACLTTILNVETTRHDRVRCTFAAML